MFKLDTICLYNNNNNNNNNSTYIVLFNKHDVGSMRFRNMVTKTYIQVAKVITKSENQTKNKK